EAHLLLRLQSDPARQSRPAWQATTAAARTSAVSGRLAAALLRFLGAGTHRFHAGWSAGVGCRSEDRLGAGASRTVSGGCEHCQPGNIAARTRIGRARGE